MPDELVTVVDESNRNVGAVPRRVMRQQRLRHRAVYVFVSNSRGEVYVQRRSPTKDIYPDYWDPAAGGVVRADEAYEETATREVNEELGVCGVPLHALFDFYFENVECRVWGRVFSCVYDGELKLQAEEVETVELMTIGQIFARAGQENFTPDSVEALRRYVAQEHI
jgi:8-oxo-dGTP pyrophosphatase MutT (NUDIX family)